MQVGDGGRRAHAAALGDLVHPDAVLLAVVEVLVASQPGLYAGLDERVRDAVVRALLADRERPAGAVESGGATLVVLGLDEVRQEVGPAPSRDAPGVVVERVAADVDHRVDRRGASEHSPARQRYASLIAVGFRRRVVVPVDLRRAELQVAERDVDVFVDVRRPGLQQQHLHVRVFAEARRQHAARRSSPDDHVVVHSTLPFLGRVPSPARDDTGRRAAGLTIVAVQTAAVAAASSSTRGGTGTPAAA